MSDVTLIRLKQGTVNYLNIPLPTEVPEPFDGRYPEYLIRLDHRKQTATVVGRWNKLHIFYHGIPLYRFTDETRKQMLTAFFKLSGDAYMALTESIKPEDIKKQQ